jgi:hypothetical protein
MNEQEEELLRNVLNAIYDGSTRAFQDLRRLTWAIRTIRNGRPARSRDAAIDALVNAIASRGELSPAPPADPVSHLVEQPRLILL